MPDLDLVKKSVRSAAELTGNFVVILIPLFPQSRDRVSRSTIAVKQAESMQCQGEQIQRLQKALERQQAAAAQVGTEQPAPPAVVPTVVEGVAAATIPVTAIAAGSGTSNLDEFSPPTFDREKVEPSMVEAWIDSMESLFEDIYIYTLEKDKVHLATHCLEKAANVWWEQVSQVEIRRSFGGRFPAGILHIIDCVSDVVRDDRDRADWFLRGLRPEIYKAVQILKLTTFAKVFDRALWAEHGNAYAREERESMAESRDKGKKRAAGAGGRPNAKKPPQYPRQQSKNWRPSQCVICGSKHRPSACPQREGKCYKCGQAEHIVQECLSWASSAPTAASVLSTPRQLIGLPPTLSAGRASAPRQPEGSRAPSGRDFATQVEEPAVQMMSWQVLF
uniref:CCHC-type domain-containing protein n=1 Tax=Ananas comosus var. bracteatus TaxID=296719 RepID=A0A6V7QH84_ANACO|nr:unnamed protein product [Ananas comosus var. bracteatus]